MSRLVAPESEEGKERLRWEMYDQHWNGETIPCGRPFGQYATPYPKMLYKAQLVEGRIVCMEPAPQPDGFEKPHDYDRAVRLNEAFNKSCYRIVPDEGAHRLAAGQGWCDTPDLAVANFEAEQQAIGNAAAERAFTDRSMSLRAKEEAAQADAATHEHVADVPAPKKRPYRKKVRHAPSPDASV